MALAAFSDRSKLNSNEREFCSQLINDYNFRETKVADFKDSVYYNCNVETEQGAAVRILWGGYHQ